MTRGVTRITKWLTWTKMRQGKIFMFVHLYLHIIRFITDHLSFFVLLKPKTTKRTKKKERKNFMVWFLTPSNSSADGFKDILSCWNIKDKWKQKYPTEQVKNHLVYWDPQAWINCNIFWPLATCSHSFSSSAGSEQCKNCFRPNIYCPIGP